MVFLVATFESNSIPPVSRSERERASNVREQSRYSKSEFKGFNNNLRHRQ